jgi:probable rRNA maturation factor
MAISTTNKQKDLPINENKLKRRLGKVLANLDLKGSGLSVLITNDKEIRRLNKEFRGIDTPTNVLSFPAMGLPKDGIPCVNLKVPKHLRNYLGDIAISATTVKREAKDLDLEVGYLFYFYLIHSILHLIGYDHELSKSAEKAQDKETLRLMDLIKYDLE